MFSVLKRLFTVPSDRLWRGRFMLMLIFLGVGVVFTPLFNAPLHLGREVYVSSVHYLAIQITLWGILGYSKVHLLKTDIKGRVKQGKEKTPTIQQGMKVRATLLPPAPRTRYRDTNAFSYILVEVGFLTGAYLYLTATVFICKTVVIVSALLLVRWRLCENPNIKGIEEALLRALKYTLLRWSRQVGHLIFIWCRPTGACFKAYLPGWASQHISSYKRFLRLGETMTALRRLYRQDFTRLLLMMHRKALNIAESAEMRASRR